MNILPILSHKIFQAQNNNVANKTYFTKPSLNKDTVSFSGNSDLLKLSKKEIFERLDTAIKNPENLIGEGGEACVYKIPETNYCVRILKGRESDYDKALLFDIGEDEKINHIVAKLGRGSSIMTKLEGKPVWTAGIKPEELAKNIEAVESVPVSGFKSLIAQVCNANKHDLLFDCTAANVIVNPRERTLTAIDFFKTPFYDPFSPLKKIYSSLTHFYPPIQYKRICAAKIILAACEDLQEGVNSKAPIGGYDFNKLVFKLANDDVIKDKTYTNALYKVLDKFTELGIKQCFGQDCRTQFQGQMKVLNTLLKQIF